MTHESTKNSSRAAAAALQDARPRLRHRRRSAVALALAALAALLGVLARPSPPSLGRARPALA